MEQTKKQKILFAVFLILLILPVVSFPMMKNFIDSENHEKRVYAEFPTLSNFNILTFSEEFEDAFLDHLPYKNQLTAFQNQRNSLLGVGTTIFEYEDESSIVIEGSENWLFYNAHGQGEYSLRDYLGTNLYEEDKMAEIASTYTSFQNYLKETYDCDVVFLFVPNKEQIYSEYMPKNLIQTSYNRTNQLTDYLTEHTDVPVIYAKDALTDSKEVAQLYFKYDTHWNHLGAFVASQLVRQEITGESVSLSDVEFEIGEENMTGDLANLLSMGSVYNDDVDYLISYHDGALKTEGYVEEEYYYYYEGQGEEIDDQTVILLGDSFAPWLADAMKVDYGKLIYLPGTDRFKKLFEEYEPKTLVIEISERSTLRQEGWPAALEEILRDEN